MSVSPSTVLDKAVLEEAVDWVMRLHFDTVDAASQREFERWHAQSPGHRAAWARAQTVLGAFDTVPSGIAKSALQSLDGDKRRRTRRLLTLAMVSLPVGALVAHSLPWAEWTADVATATGERKSMTMADGTHIVLNTASAIDIAYTATQRTVLLRAGEILITTGKRVESPYRPFIVQTPQGVVQALGTRFSVRRQGDLTQVAVFQHAVEIRPVDGAPARLHAGQQTVFDTQGARMPTPIDDTATSWEDGMLVARNMRLYDVLAEMGRYRVGYLRCHPSVAELRVSGAISLMDTDAGLMAIARILPVRISRLSRYWVTVEAAPSASS